MVPVLRVGLDVAVDILRLRNYTDLTALWDLASWHRVNIDTSQGHLSDPDTVLMWHRAAVHAADLDILLRHSIDLSVIPAWLQAGRRAGDLVLLVAAGCSREEIDEHQRNRTLPNRDALRALAGLHPNRQRG